MNDGLTATNSEELDEFSNFDTLAEKAAFIFKRDGGAFLRKALEMSGNKGIPEVVEDAAIELRRMGLHAVAKIVAEHAAICLPMDDMSRCPYPQTPENARSIEAWLRSQRQRWKRRR